ncbi:2'-5'-oligoadenylate synthase 1-like [Lissotriton helveticus]
MAFDRVKWPYLFAVLAKLGFGEGFIGWGGSSAKGTALREGSDADLVVFLTSIDGYSQLESKRKEIIEEIQKRLEECQSEETFEVKFKPTKWDDPRVLRFKLRSNTMREYIEFDLLPAYDALGQLQKGMKVDPEIYVKLIENWSPSKNFSTSFTEIQRDFIVSLPTKVKSLIRLVKHWYKMKLMKVKKEKELKNLPPKYALELLSIYAWQEGSGGQEGFNMAQAFRNFLELICNYKNLCVYGQSTITWRTTWSWQSSSEVSWPNPGLLFWIQQIQQGIWEKDTTGRQLP